MRADAPRVLIPLTAAIVAAYFLFFTAPALGLYFDQDDMLNLYMIWTKPLRQVLVSLPAFWNDFNRPLGGLFYRALFAAAGFDPRPFHAVLLALGLVNI